MSTSFYLIRPYPGDVLRIADFKEKSIAAIGWSRIGDMSGKSSDEVREMIKEAFREQPEKVRSVFSTFKIFLGLNKGDYIIAPESGMGPVHIAKVTGTYRFAPEYLETDYAHQCDVKWVKTIERENISDTGLSNALKFPGTASNLHSRGDALRALLGLRQASAQASPVVPSEEPAEAVTPVPARSAKTPVPAAPEALGGVMTVEYPLRPGVFCKITLPADTTEDEARRLGVFAGTLYFK